MKATLLLTAALALAPSLAAQNQVLKLQDKTRLQVHLGENETLYVDGTCDSERDIYVTIFDPRQDPSDHPLFKIDSSGQLKARFASSKEYFHAGIGEDHFEPFALLRDGGVVRLSWLKDKMYVTRFAPYGKLLGRIVLDPPAIVPGQLAVFLNGEMLVSGIEYSHSRSVRSHKAFTAIYDPQGHLAKRLTLPGDAEIEKAVEAGDSRYFHGPYAPPYAGNLAVSGGAARLGEDGNVYLMRRTSPATIYVISSSGELIRTLSVAAASASLMPISMQLGGDHVAIAFLGECSDGQCADDLVIADSRTGETVKNYEQSKIGSLACYEQSSERITTVDISGNHAVEIARWAVK